MTDALPSLHRRLLGRWIVEHYHIGEASHATRGMLMVTPSHLMSTIIYDVGTGQSRASANAGAYRLEGSDIMLVQDMQLHYDTQDSRRHLLTEGVPERIGCTFIGDDRLMLLFPSANRFECRRAPEER